MGLRQAGGNSFAGQKTIFRLKTSESPIAGVVIRSGERGVLLFDRGSGTVRFQPWEGIKSIESPAIRVPEFESQLGPSGF